MIAVAGATGYIGGLLAEKLREAGKDVRALARNPDRAAHLEELGCEVHKADVLEADTLGPALEGVDVAYYLVHSMGRGSADGDFARRDHEGGGELRRGAAAAGVRRIVYLGGLGEGSEHLASRHATAEALQAGEVPVAYFRAAAVIGRRQRVLPHRLLPGQAPAADGDAALGHHPHPADRGRRRRRLSRGGGRLEAPLDREIQIGGPDVTTYGGMIDELAQALGRRPPARFVVPVLTPRLSSLWIGLVTPVDAGVARPLIEGLATETIVTDPSGMELLPQVRRTPLSRALTKAVEGIDPLD